MIVNVWEWTASTFLPYPGFVRDPYQEYSEPWFGTHKVLRGGSFATPSRVAHAAFRNFYTPDRADIFAGFPAKHAVECMRHFAERDEEIFLLVAVGGERIFGG